MEIEVGEYIKTKTGFIGKVISKHGGYGLHYELDVKKEIQDNFMNGIVHEDNIAKHSKNIIDLIEYRDLIKFKNPIKVSTIKNDKEKEIKFLDAYFCDGFMDYEGNKDTFMLYNLDYVINTKNIKNEDIDYILTHEQIVQNCYRLEE